MSLIRYPGSKAKLADAILARMPDFVVLELWTKPSAHYFEPFFGSGAIGFAVMREMHHKSQVTLADADIGIVSLWQAVRDYPKELQTRIWHYKPTVESFYELKQADGTFTDIVDTGFRKLALHRTSVSGYGAMAGGPIGGRHQKGDYSVDCRWRPARMKHCIDSLHRLFHKFDCVDILHQDAFDTLDQADTSTADTVAVYLDPPYYEKGSQLYAVKFSDEQHERLAERLKSASFWWSLSYDDHEQIRKWYSGCHFERLELVYTNAVTRSHTRRKNQEILIMKENSYCNTLSKSIR